MGFVTGMLAGCGRRGLDAAPLLARAGINIADTANRVPVDRYAALYNLLCRELDDEAFGLCSRPMPPGSFEFLGRSVLSARSLAAALERAGRFLRLVLPDLAVSLSRQGAWAEIVIAERRPLAADPADAGRVFAFEWLLRLLHCLACWLVERNLALDSVAFPFPRPPHADDYRLIYTEQATFDAPVLRARCRAEFLDLPVRRDEAALETFLVGAPGRISTLYRRDRTLAPRVRDLLRENLPAPPDLDVVAHRLHLSPRTLHRRLEEEGTSFRAVKEALRRELALERLARTADPVARISADLGYADPSVFYRACVAWTGASPSAYRRQLAGKR